MPSPLALIACFVVCAAPSSSAAAAAAATTTISLGDARAVGKVNERYASWNIDSSYNRGFVHTAFDNPNLLAAARDLHPSTLRFGGSGNDYLSYQPFSGCNSSADNDNFVCLNASHWDKLYALAEKSGTDFLFGVSYDLAAACAANASSYVWTSDAAVAMVKAMLAKNQTMWGFELGNEINNSEKKCQTSGAQQAAAFQCFKRDVLDALFSGQQPPRLLGPDIGYLDPEHFLADFLSHFAEVDAVTYHVYSSVQRRNFNDPAIIDHALHADEAWYPSLVHAKARKGAQVWAGEDGPIGGGEDGTCGAYKADGAATNLSACGTFATVPWYANDLGLRARLGFSQYQRQDLIGGRYGLLAADHDGEYLAKDAPRLGINPDFWIPFLWKRTMGAVVLNASASVASSSSFVSADPDPDVRVYAHCGVPPSTHRADSVYEYRYSLASSSSLFRQQQTAPLGLVLININAKESKTVDLMVPSSGVGVDSDSASASAQQFRHRDKGPAGRVLRATTPTHQEDEVHEATCEENLCHICNQTGPVRPDGSQQGTCCNSTWTCFYDQVFGYPLCLPDHPWICQPPPQPARNRKERVEDKDEDEDEDAVESDGEEPFQVWSLTASPDGGVFGKACLLNGQALPQYFQDGKTIGDIPVAGVPHSGQQLVLPPFSVTFVVASWSATATTCPAAEFIN